MQNKQEKICVVGLGYVGLPLAVLLAKHFAVIGFDINEPRINELKNNRDHTNELSSEQLAKVKIAYSSDPTSIRQSKFIIIAVPTPVDVNKIPDLTIVEKATELVGKNLAKGAVVVYESTVYPGVTEDICLPILTKNSGLKCGQDFWLGYSPERVNPGDKEHTIDRITKIVSGSDSQSLDLIAAVYGTVTKVHRASSIKVAEAAKVIENTQRDLNIALMNELAILFNKMGISIYEVLAAAGTKWNFLPFKPGLVGGHCIGVDPYYLTYKAREVGHNPEVILAGRGINDSMHKFIAHQIIKKMVTMGKDISQSKFVVFGITFKENIPDIRNSKVAELCQELQKFGVKPVIYDPLADPHEVKEEYSLELCGRDDLPKADTLIVAVAHADFKAMTVNQLKGLMNDKDLLLVDVKHIYDRQTVEEAGINYWSL